MDIVIPQDPKRWGCYFEHLNVCIEAAKSFGNNPIVLEPFDDCPGIAEVRANYRHHSPNTPWFELWCFESWFYIAEWMRRNKKDVVMKIDSDVLLFADMQGAYEHEFRKPFCTRPVTDPILTLAAAEKAVEFILVTFRHELERQICGERNVADQFVLDSCFKETALDVGGIHLLSAIDPNLYIPGQHGLAHEGHKDIWFINGQPCWLRPWGFTRMLSLHCWGKAKAAMPRIWQQAQESKKGTPVRLTIE